MQTTEDPSISSIIGNSPQIIDLKQAVLKIAPRNTTVLITGETGTGKELFAQALHQGSLRRFKPFVRVNCAAIPETLLESELFGYADGSFTGGKKVGGTYGQAGLKGAPGVWARRARGRDTPCPPLLSRPSRLRKPRAQNCCFAPSREGPPNPHPARPSKQFSRQFLPDTPLSGSSALLKPGGLYLNNP